MPLQVASDLWRPIPERSKDYICTPKANGYQVRLKPCVRQQFRQRQPQKATRCSRNLRPVRHPAPALQREARDPHVASVQPPLDLHNLDPFTLPPTPVRFHPWHPPLPHRQSIHLTLQLGQLDMSYSEHDSFNSPSYSSSSSYDSAGPYGTHGMSGSGFTSPESSSDFLDSADYGSVGPGSTATGRRSSGAAAAVAAEAAAAAGALCMELQIRTAAMDRAAESGDAAHAVYKGGLDLSTARQLQVG